MDRLKLWKDNCVPRAGRPWAADVEESRRPLIVLPSCLASRLLTAPDNDEFSHLV